MTISEQQRAAVAYLRRSAATESNPGNDSREAQLSAVQRLCGPDVTVYEDWGKSGSGDGSKRPEYQRLKAEIAAGRIGSVCAYSLTRLGRNARELLALVELCRVHDVTLRTASESIDTSSAMGRAMVQMMAVMAELELEQGKERSASARAARVERHRAAGLDVPGSRAMYGTVHVTQDGITRTVEDTERPIGPVLDAYRDAGSVRGACQLLRERAIPAPRGGEVWGVSTLRRILDHYAAIGQVELPEVMSREAGRRPVKATALFAGLLRCHCGRTMTPNVVRGQYYCAAGRDSGAALHGRYSVTERALLAVLEPEAARYLRQTKIGRKAAANDQQERERLTARRERIADSYLNGIISAAKAERGQEVAEEV